MEEKIKNAGFTYIDLLITIVIISVALVSLTGLFIVFERTISANESEKAAALLARMQIDYLKQYEGRQFDRLNPHWREICPEVYLAPPNIKVSSENGQKQYKFQVTSTVLKGLLYKDANGKLFDDPNAYDGKSSVDMTSGVSADSEIPEDIVRNLNIVPVRVRITWEEAMANGPPAEKQYEIIYYYLGSPEI